MSENITTKMNAKMHTFIFYTEHLKLTRNMALSHLKTDIKFVFQQSKT